MKWIMKNDERRKLNGAASHRGNMATDSHILDACLSTAHISSSTLPVCALLNCAADSTSKPD
jgi:hypothetical protein